MAQPLSAAALQAKHAEAQRAEPVFHFDENSPDPFPAIADSPAPTRKKAAPSSSLDVSSESAFPSLAAPPPRPAAGLWGAGASSKIKSAAASAPSPVPSSSGRSTPSGIEQPVIARSVFQDSLALPQAHIQAVLSTPGEGRQAREKPKTVGELLKKVMSATGARVESSTASQTKLTTFLVKAPSEEAVQKAKKMLLAALSRRITLTVDVPNSVRAVIIGPKGATLKSITEATGTRINLPPRDPNEAAPTSRGAASDSDSDSDSDAPEPTTALTIEGDEHSASDARARILELVRANAASASKRVKHIPTSFYPLIAQRSGALEQTLQVQIAIPSQGRLRALAHQAVGEESELSEKERARSAAIVVKGEKAQIKKAVAALERLYDDAQRTTRTITIPIPKRQHRTLIGPVGDEILAQTSCIVELPPIDEASDNCTIRGPQAKLPAALQLVMEKANAQAVETVDLLSAHRSGGGLDYGKSLLRYLLRTGKLRKIADAHTGAKIYPPRPAFIESSGTVVLDIVADEPEKAEKTREEVAELVKGIPPSAVEVVEIDYLLHRHLVGKKARAFEDAKSVALVFPPQDEDRSEVILVYTAAPSLGKEGKSRDVEIREAVEDAKKELDRLVKQAAEITSRTINVDPKFHGAIIGPHGTTLNAVIGEDKAVSVQIGSSKPGKESKGTPAIKGDEILVRGPKDEVERVVGELLRIAEEAANHDIIHGYTVNFEIESQYVPHLVGKAGAAISRLREALGVNVDFDDQAPADVSAPAKKPSKKAKTGVKIVGRKENVEEAKKRVLAQVEKFADETTEKIKVAPQYHASLIGSGGKYAIRLEEKHGVKITFPRDREATEGNDEVLIRGGKKGVAQAKAEILEALEFEKEHSNSATVSVPAAAIPRIVGKGGSQINEIKEATDAQIDVDRSGEGATTMITLRGTKKAIAAAKSAILAISNEISSQDTVVIDSIPSKFHRTIIGPGGSRLRELVIKAGGPAEASAQAGLVRFPRQGEAGDSITVRGEKSLVAKIKAELERVGGELRDRVVLGTSIPAPSHREIIGRGGTGLQALQAKHNVQIQFPGWREYNSSGAPENAAELESAPAESIVKVIGARPAAEAAIQDLSSRATAAATVSSTINVPVKYHHAISEGGQFFRSLRSYGVTVDHSKVPAKPTSDLPKPSFLPVQSGVAAAAARIDAEEDTVEDDGELPAHSWEVLPLHASEEEEDATWTVKAKDQAGLDRAEKAIRDAITRAEKTTHVGYLTLSDRSSFPRIVGTKGSGIQKIRGTTEAEVTVSRDGDVPLITLVGSRDAVEKAKDYILTIRPNRRY